MDDVNPEILAGLRSHEAKKRGEAAVKAKKVALESPLSPEVLKQLVELRHDNYPVSTGYSELKQIKFYALEAVLAHLKKYRIQEDILYPLFEPITDSRFRDPDFSFLRYCSAAFMYASRAQSLSDELLGRMAGLTGILRNDNTLSKGDPDFEVDRHSAIGLAHQARIRALPLQVIERLVEVVQHGRSYSQTEASQALANASERQQLPDDLFRYYSSFLQNENYMVRTIGAEKLTKYSKNQKFPEDVLTQLAFTLNDNEYDQIPDPSTFTKDTRQLASEILTGQLRTQPDKVREVLNDIIESWQADGTPDKLNAAKRAQAILAKTPQTLPTETILGTPTAPSVPRQTKGPPNRN